MANQSDIQSLIQQLAGTHTAGQANVPSAVNNGNPNTTYNMAPSQGGYLPPVSNGFDQWRINPGPNWQQMATQGGGGGWGNFTPTLPHPPATVPTTAPTSWGFPTPGTTTPPATPLPGTGGTPTVPPGTPPTQVTPGMGSNAGNGAEGNRTGSGRGLDWIDLPPSDLGFSDHPTGNNTGLSGDIGSAYGWGGMAGKDIQETLGASLNLGQAGVSLANSSLGRALGIKSDGSIAMGQILDFFIPGNVYMGQTGKLNLLNMVPALLSKLNPILGVAANAAMKWLATHTKIRVFKNWAQRNQDNRAAAFGGGAPGGGSSPGLGGGWFGTGVPSASNGGRWVDSNGNPVDPGTFGSYWIDPTSPNDAYSGSNNPFGSGGTHPTEGSNSGTGTSSSQGQTFDWLKGGGRSGWGNGQGPNYS